MEVFLTSPWIPAEWVRAHGLQPRGIWSAKRFRPGSSSLSAGVCAFSEAAVQFSEAAADSAVIFSTACDQMRRGCDAAIFHKQERAFLFNLPATWQTAAARQIFRSELERLGQFLLTIGGHAPLPEMLRQELLHSEGMRKRLSEDAPVSSARGFAEAVARFHWDGAYSPPLARAQDKHVPIALVGGPFLAPHWKLLDVIEAAGGRVDLNATEFGERSLPPAFEFGAGANQPFEVLAQGYCDNMVDVFQRPNTRLYSWLESRLKSRQARGIVLWHFTGCDLWRAEAQSLREAFGLPLLMLEAGEEPGVAQRLNNRVEAFVETLK
jgi:hypothetical protein